MNFIDIWGLIQPIVLAVLAALFARSNQKSKKRAEVRAEESKLAMNLSAATIKLCIVTAKTVRNEQVNGDMNDAMEHAERAQKEYQEFLHRVTAERV
jgi:hypothetical protein